MTVRPQAALDPAQSPIFVVGSGRSGTTLLRMMLSAHPAIHLTHEASFYMWEIPREPVWDFVRRYVRGLHFRWLRLDPARVFERLPETPTHRDVHTAVMRSAAEAAGKSRWGDKTPSHSSKLDRIFEDYPDARVVRIVRDPVATVASLNRMPWFPGSFIAGCVLVGSEEKQCARYRDRILEVRLETLLAEPETTLRSVLEHVGEPWDPGVLDHAANAPDDLPPLPWFARASGRAEQNRVARPALDPAQIRVIEWLASKPREQHGYPIVAMDVEPRLASKVFRYVRDVPEFFRGTLALVYCLWRMSRPDGAERAALNTMRFVNPSAMSAFPAFEMPEPPALPEGWEAGLRGS